MKKEDLETFACKAAKGLKTQEDLNDFQIMLTKVTVEAALYAELDDHLGYLSVTVSKAKMLAMA